MPKNWYQNTTVQVVLAVALALALAVALIGPWRKKPPADLATSHYNRGIDRADQGQLDDAIEDYDKAIAIFSRLVDQEGRAELANRLAASHNNRGEARRAQGRLDAAIEDYDKAIAISSRLVDQEGRAELANDLARGHHNRGNARDSQGQFNAAIEDYDKAIAIRTRLVEQEGRAELANDLAKSLAARGLALASDGQAGRARADFTKALEFATDERRRESIKGVLRELPPPPPPDDPPSNKIFCRVLFPTTTIRHTNTRIRPDLANELAGSLYNRGIARREQGRREQAIADFTKALRLAPNRGLREMAAGAIRELGEQ